MHSFPEVWIIVEEERNYARDPLLAFQSTYKARQKNQTLGFIHDENAKEN